MQMKKLVSFVAAAAMATAFCVPAFAATPGEQAGDVAQEIIDTVGTWSENKEQTIGAMENLTDMVTDDQAITVNQKMNNAGCNFFDVAESVNDGTIAKVETGVEASGCKLVYRKDSEANDLTINGFSWNPDAGVITVDAVQEGNNSKYGYAITIELPANTGFRYYNVAIVGGQLFNVTVPVATYIDRDGVSHDMVTFWAPHFTTYQLTPVNVNNGGNEGGESNQGGEQTVTSDDNKEETTTSTTTTTTTTVTENPIKATGVSMNMSVFAVVACAAVAACGAGVAVKKSHKGE